MIGGIVLAAGRSRRMGEPKAMMTFRGRIFLDRAIDTLRAGGCERVVVVIADPEADPAAMAVSAHLEARFAADAELHATVRRAVNLDPESEQLDSLRVGLRSLPGDVEAVLVLPVDVPTADPGTARALIDAYVRRGAPIVLPTLHGHHGHPILLARSIWPELLERELPEGVRTVIHADPGRIEEVPVDALPHDVDTMDDYRLLLQDPRWTD